MFRFWIAFYVQQYEISHFLRDFFDALVRFVFKNKKILYETITILFYCESKYDNVVRFIDIREVFRHS